MIKTQIGWDGRVVINSNWDTAIERIANFEPADGYYIALSPGKDSRVIADLADKAGVKHEKHHELTTVTPPEGMYFLRETYADININVRKTMWQIIVENKNPPTQLQRYCCRELKELGGEGRFKITGVRWKESTNRQNKRKLTEHCMQNHTKTLNPIIDWTDGEVWEYIRSNDLNYCSLYDKGYSRVGCIMCPYKSKSERLYDASRYPKYYKNYLKAFTRMLEARDKAGLNTTWGSAKEVMDWWILRPPKSKEGQIGMF